MVDTALNGKIIGYIDGHEGTRILSIDGGGGRAMRSNMYNDFNGLA